jgi:hypothetical protein
MARTAAGTRRQKAMRKKRKTIFAAVFKKDILNLRDGFVYHGSGCLGKITVFFGFIPTGAGKSTAGGAAPEAI